MKANMRTDMRNDGEVRCMGDDASGVELDRESVCESGDVEGREEGGCEVVRAPCVLLRAMEEDERGFLAFGAGFTVTEAEAAAFFVAEVEGWASRTRLLALRAAAFPADIGRGALRAACESAGLSAQTAAQLCSLAYSVIPRFRELGVDASRVGDIDRLRSVNAPVGELLAVRDSVDVAPAVKAGASRKLKAAVRKLNAGESVGKVREFLVGAKSAGSSVREPAEKLVVGGSVKDELRLNALAACEAYLSRCSAADAREFLNSCVRASALSEYAYK